MEYLPTDLPKYMKTTSREAVANSPVEAGHVLLFSEDGTSLTAKKSDGSFESVGGGMDFYKCSAINTSTTARPEGYTLKLHCVNAENPSDTLDYNFTMVDAGATGGNRTWQDTTVELSATQVFDGNNGSVMTWIISKIGESPTTVLQTVENSAKNNPWEITQLKSPSTGKIYNATWTLSAPDGTWSGYKAVLTDGGYVFSETSTAGLRYQGGFTPQVGTIYSQDAKVKVAQLMEATAAIPQDGLVFWMPFDGSTEARLGSVAPASDSYTGNITYETHGGITYANVSNMLYKTKLGGDSGINYPCTIIAYVKIDSGCAQGVMIDFKAPGDYYSAGSSSLSYYNGAINSDFPVETGKFHFYCHRQTAVRAYSVTWDNATKEHTLGSDFSAFGYMYIGGNTAMPKLTGGFFDVAVYDRVLTDAEVTALYQRVIPLQA